MKTDRFYEIDNVTYPSVTTILSVLTSPKLLRWQLDQAALGRNVGQKAMSIGTKVHKAIEKFTKTGKEPNLKAWGYESKSCWQAFRRWMDVEKPVIHQAERVVVNEEMGYAGTCDAVVKLGGWKMVVDYKSSEHVNTVYWLQLAAYAKVLGADCVGVIRLDKFLGEYEQVIRPYSEEDYERFLDIKRVWKWIRKEEGDGVT